MFSNRTKKLLELARMDLGLDPPMLEEPIFTVSSLCSNNNNYPNGTPSNYYDENVEPTIEENYVPPQIQNEINSDDSIKDKTYDPHTDSSSEDDIPQIAIRTKLVPRGNLLSKEQDGQHEMKKRSVDGPFTRKKKQERREKRNTGQSYVTSKGNEVKQREMKALINCRMKCREKIPQDIRQAIFKDYWSLGSRDKRVCYIANHSNTTTTAVKRKRTNDASKSRNRNISHSFFFKLRGEKVKVCFMRVLDETQMFVTLAIKNSQCSISGVVQPDRRGRHEPKNKHSGELLQEAIDHIKSFPAHKSHYTRRTNDKKYLSPSLTLQKMYELYCENRDNPVSRRIYEREFHKLKLAFKKPKIDTCHKCDVLEMQIRVAEETEGAAKETIKNEKEAHLLEADNAYKQKDFDKSIAKQNDDTKCYSFDLQQCLPTPFVNSSVSFYKRQLWTFNLTIHDMGSGKVTCFMWHEAEGGRGGNQIATCIFLQLLSLPDNIKHVILYCDTCGGQNKNSHVAAMFLTLMQQTQSLQTIDHKFMVSGHSHMECDVDHALIEKQKKKLSTDIFHPHDWYQLVRSVGKKRKFLVKERNYDRFLDFADLYKNGLILRKKDSSGNSFKCHDVQWLRYTKEHATILFKKSLSNEGEFQEICFARRGRIAVLSPKKCYAQKPPISKEKKDDLIQLPPLISPIFRQFYLDLPTSEAAQDTFPDVVEFSED